MAIDRLGTLAAQYHDASRNNSALRHVLSGHQVHYDPDILKLAAEAPLQMPDAQRTALPSPRGLATMSLEHAIQHRRSRRDFDHRCLKASDLSAMLYFANGVRSQSTNGHHTVHWRNVPSSGNLGSIELYPIILDVEGIEPGIHHFDTVSHDLALLKKGHFGRWLEHCVLYQSEFSRASVALVVTASFGRLGRKYGPRAYRLAHLDAGHVSAHCYLVATALGLSVCATAGFIEAELDSAIGLDEGDSASLLVILLGPGSEAGGDRSRHET